MRHASAVLLALACAACAGMDDNVRQSAETVLTLQSGTISALKAKRGTGPFRTYDLPPDELLVVVRDATRKARGLGGLPVRAVFVSDAKREVVAKEREPDQAADDAYDGPFRTAMVATVHAIPGRPDASKLEVHALGRGPFHRGLVRWERDLPKWIDEVLAERAADRIQPIP